MFDLCIKIVFPFYVLRKKYLFILIVDCIINNKFLLIKLRKVLDYISMYERLVTNQFHYLM